MLETIAIFWATSHIAKNLLFYFSKNTEYIIDAYVRDEKKLFQFIKIYNLPASRIQICDIKNTHFIQSSSSYKLIINCIGVWKPNILKEIWWKIIFLTEKYDNLIIDYLKKNKETLYVHMSSWAVYKGNFSKAIDSDTHTNININNIDDSYYYFTSKLYAEIKHRSLSDLKIVDLRIFSFYSQFIDIDASFFMSQLIKSIKNKTPFQTNTHDFIRDFISPFSLFTIILKLLQKKHINTWFDVVSDAPITKNEILDLLQKKYTLTIKYTDINFDTISWKKDIYYSKSTKLKNTIWEYTDISSQDTIIEETNKILQA